MQHDLELLDDFESGPYEVAARLVETRKAAGLTQRDLANRLGISLWNLDRLESGKAALDQLSKEVREAVQEFTGSVPTASGSNGHDFPDTAVPARPTMRPPMPPNGSPVVKSRPAYPTPTRQAPPAPVAAPAAPVADSAGAATPAPFRVAPPPTAPPAHADSLEATPAVPSPVPLAPVAAPAQTRSSRVALAPTRQPPRRRWLQRVTILLPAAAGIVALGIAVLAGDDSRPSPTPTPAPPAASPEPVKTIEGLSASDELVAQRDAAESARALAINAAVDAERRARAVERRRLKQEKRATEQAVSTSQARLAPAPVATAAPKPRNTPPTHRNSSKKTPEASDKGDDPGRTPPPEFARP